MTEDPDEERKSQIGPQPLSQTEKPDTTLAVTLSQESFQSAHEDGQELRLPLDSHAVLLPVQPAVLLCAVSYRSRSLPVQLQGSASGDLTNKQYGNVATGMTLLGALADPLLRY